MRSPIIKPKFFLPLMVCLGALALFTHLNEAWDSLVSGRLFQAVTSAYAASGNQAPPSKDAAPAAAKENKAPDSATPSLSTEKPHDETSGTEMELVKQLSDRRNQLDARARSLDAREDLIHVAEQRVDQKIKEMETLRTQLQAMVNQIAGTQQAQLDNLVKIYETMKPKEAARIFEALEMPVLLGVVQRMKPQRTAAVMAEMAPEKAKEITVALTKQDQLPQVK
jgi:flagellar motility protein MotE (MotC chaperone)